MRFIAECLGEHARGFLYIQGRELAANRSLVGEQKRFSDTVQVWIERLRHKITGFIIPSHYSLNFSGDDLC